jgi:hypothetical protein
MAHPVTHGSDSDWGSGMTSEVKLFMEAVESATGRIPVWYPGTDVELGDIGVFEDGVWIPKTTLNDQGIPFRKHHDQSPSAGLDLAHGESWTVAGNAGAGGGVPGGPSAHGLLHLALSGAGSFVLRTSDSLVHRIANLDEVEAEMISRFQARDGSWDEKWCMVSEVFVASRAFIAVASSSGASLDLDLGVQPSGAFLDLSEASVGARIGITSNVSTKVLAMSPSVLTFNIRRATWGGARGDRRLDIPVSVEPVKVADLDWSVTPQSSSAGGSR